MATKYIILRSGTEWQIPTDYDSSSPMTFHCIGAGGGGGCGTSGTGGRGGGGGGGGAYSSSAITVTAGARLYYSIGAGGIGAINTNSSGTAGGDTWINWNTSTNTSSNTPPTSNGTGVLAKGGGGGQGNGTGGTGGVSASGFGTTKFSGGTGGTSSAFGGGGGGGAGKSTQNGGNGGGSSNYGGGGGGGYGAGTTATTTIGGTGGTNSIGGTAAGGGLNTAGTAGASGGGGGGGGATTGGSNAGAGGSGGANTSTWTTVSGYAGYAGGGGGGGGSSSTGLTGGGATGTIAGSGGGGGGSALSASVFPNAGGAGGAGTIIVQYEVKPKLKTVILTSGSSWTVPSDWTDAGSSIIAIGGGGGAGRAGFGSGAGGGGGALSAISGTDLTGGLTPGANVYYSIGASGSGATANNTSGATGGDTWFNKNSAAVPSATTDGVLAKGGNGGSGGTAGAGGAGGAAASCVGIVRKSGGSGGAGSGSTTSGGGGGGSAASIIANGFNGSAGAIAIYTSYAGGNGGGVSGEGLSSLVGGGGGAGFNGLRENAGGTGGFGGTIINAGSDPGGNGNEFGTAGSGGGGSGGGGAVIGGNGGNYGGGGGGGGFGSGQPTTNGGNGAPGAIIIQYISYSLPTTDGSPISLFDIQRVFGGSNPISISEYYAGGTYVPAGTTGTYGAVPTSGAISLRNFYGTGITVIPYFGQSANDTVWGVYADPILLTASKSSGNFSIEYIEESFTTVKHNFNANGTFAWGKTAGNLYTQGNHIDSSGNYYTVGWYSSTNVRAYIAKFNSSGTLTYHREYTGGGSLQDVYTGVSTGPSGNTYVCGYYDITSGGAVYPMITKYNPSGTILYQRGRQLGTLGNLYLDGKVNSSETAYVAVGYYRTTSSRTNPLIEYWTGIGTSTPTISWAKYSSAAVNSFSRFISVEIDSGGNVIAVGSIDGTAYVAKFDSSGTLLWHKKVTGISSDVTTVQVDSSDNIYVGTYNIYFKLNSSGTFIESMSFNNNDVGYTQGFPKMSVVGSNVIFPLSTYQAGTSYSPAYGVSLEMFRVPNDASKTGNYGIYSLVRSTSFPTFTNATNGQTTLATTVTNLSRTSGSSPTVTWNNTVSLTPYNYVEFP